MAQRYVSVHLTESAFKVLSGYLEEWVMGLARHWLTAYPFQLDTPTARPRSDLARQRREEIQVPLSEILGCAPTATRFSKVVGR